MFKLREFDQQQTAAGTTAGTAAGFDAQAFDVQVFEAVAGDVAPVLGGQQAQGDLLFDPVGPAPLRLEQVAGNVAAGGVQLTPDGHPHVAVPFGPILWRSTQAWWGVIGVLVVPVDSTVTVLHEDPGPDAHAPLYLAPGVWEVVRQRQWQPDPVPALRPAGRRRAVSSTPGRVEAAERYRGPLFPRLGRTPSFRGLPIVDVEVC